MIKIDAQNVDFHYGDFHALKNISMQIEANTSVAFIGPSGCGKSTLLRMIAGLEEISDGEIAIGPRVVNDLQIGRAHV